MTHTINEFADRTTPQTHHFPIVEPVPKAVVRHIKSELRRRGAMIYDMWLPETQYLPHVLHQDEHIMGSVFGRYNLSRDNSVGRAAMVVTDQRVLFLDKKPLFVHVDELTFTIIGGITFSHVLFMSYVTLHTRLGDFKLRTFNRKNAANFVDYIETRCLQQISEPAEKFERIN